MSIERKCECGAVMGAYDLDCKSCGKSFKVRDEYLVGKDILPEPPVDLWAAQDRYAQSQKKKWARKPKSPQISSPKSSSSRGIYNFATVLLLAIAVMAAVVFRQPLIENKNALPYGILAFTLLISFIALQRNQFFNQIVMSPVQISRDKEYYRLVSSGFAHVDWNHLALNAFALISFGHFFMDFLIDAYDVNAPLVFLLIYISAIVIADLPDLIRHKRNYQYSSVGASGAISTVVAGAAISDPGMELYFFGLPSVAIPGLVYAFGYLAISMYLDYRGNGKVAHLAHAAGTVYGIALVAIISLAFGLGFANSASANTQSAQPPMTISEDSTAREDSSLIDELNSLGSETWQYSTDNSWADYGAIEVIYGGECAVLTFGSEADADRLRSSWLDLTWDGDAPALFTVANEGLVAPSRFTPCAITAAEALYWDLS